jgi:hypothetical protein
VIKIFGSAVGQGMIASIKEKTQLSKTLDAKIADYELSESDSLTTTLKKITERAYFSGNEQGKILFLYKFSQYMTYILNSPICPNKISFDVLSNYVV